MIRWLYSGFCIAPTTSESLIIHFGYFFHITSRPLTLQRQGYWMCKYVMINCWSIRSSAVLIFIRPVKHKNMSTITHLPMLFLSSDFFQNARINSLLWSSDLSYLYPRNIPQGVSGSMTGCPCGVWGLGLCYDLGRNGIELCTTGSSATRGPFYVHGFALIPARINNQHQSAGWNKLSIPKFQERFWIDNFFPHFIMEIIAHPPIKFGMTGSSDQWRDQSR